MATTRGQFAQLLAPGLTELMFEWLEEFPEEFSQFLEVETSENAYDEDQIVAGLGLARLKREGETITYDDPIQGGSKRYIMDSYALGWQVTKEMLDDEKYGLMRKIPGELMKSCRQTWEQLGANVLNLGASTMTTADGVTFFNTAHPLLGGGTYSNQLAALTDISVTSLQDILLLGENMVNERGLKMPISFDELIIPPDLQFIAGEVLQSQYKPFTGNNEINVMQGRLEPRVLHFLTSTTGWYVRSKKNNYAKFKWRVRPQVESTDDFETKGTKHSIYFRCAAGVTEWRGWARGNS
jgi:hypothetical protein